MAAKRGDARCIYFNALHRFTLAYTKGGLPGFVLIIYGNAKEQSTRYTPFRANAAGSGACESGQGPNRKCSHFDVWRAETTADRWESVPAAITKRVELKTVWLPLWNPRMIPSR